MIDARVAEVFERLLAQRGEYTGVRLVARHAPGAHLVKEDPQPSRSHAAITPVSLTLAGRTI
jgi:hypothetical protein